MRIDFFGDTDVGQVRQINEDSYLLLPDARVCVVCDGMGGHAAGEVASGEARKMYAAYFAGDSQEWREQLHFESEESWPAGAGHLVRATRLANRSIHNIASHSDTARGMGTTLVALAFDPGIVSICHVGDSRAYRLRNGKMERLTVDHSLAAELIAQNELTEEESKNFAERNVITRALGTRPDVDVDLRVEKTKAGDLFLACSDGLCGFVEDELIERTLKEAGSNYSLAIKNLLQAANATGGEDNITVALAYVGDAGSDEAAKAREAETIYATAGPTGEELDAVLPLIAEVELPDEDTQRIKLETAQKETSSQSAGKKSGGSGRLFFWLGMLLILTAVIFFGGKEFLWSGRSDTINSAHTVAEDVHTAADPAAVFFKYEATEVAGASVYVDQEFQGLAGDFAESGLSLPRETHRIRFLLDSTALYDTVVHITRDTVTLSVSSTSR